MDEESEENLGEEMDEEIKELMKNYDLDKDEAEHVKEIMEEHVYNILTKWSL